LELLASFDRSTVKGCRDLALAAIFLDTGLRLAEVCHLRTADVDLSARTLQVVVKGGQWGVGVFSPQTAQYVSDWLAVRPAGVETLFVSTRTGRALTREGLQTTVKRWGQVIGIKLSPHDFRRTFATLSTIFGAPSRVIQAAGRWSSLEMVEHYTAGIQADEIRAYLPMSKLTV
jgi:integrase/recombinase XerD